MRRRCLHPARTRKGHLQLANHTPATEVSKRGPNSVKTHTLRIEITSPPMDYNNQRQQYIDAQNYFVGDGGRWQDRPRAIALLQQVCYHYNRPIAAAARMLANCLETGESVAMDLHEARRLYESIGDAGGVSRCDCKIQIPGSDGYGPFVPESPPRRAPASNANAPRAARAASGGSQHVPQHRPVVAAAPKALPTPLPLHIERIVVLVSQPCAVSVINIL